MPKKYNIALLPTLKSEQILHLSQKFSPIADRYLLGENSLPHVTLYQFTEGENNIDTIWNLVLNHIEIKQIYLTFDKISCLTFDNVIFWTSLLPNDPSALTKMHKSIAEILNLPAKINYIPHMTLMNTKNKDYEIFSKKQLENFTSIDEIFVLSLEEADEAGQYIKTLCVKLFYSHDLNMIKKIISGGQTGVDRAALDVAIEFNIPYGGWCPEGRIDELGIIPEKYNNLKELKGDYKSERENYDVRTKKNISDSDGTLILILANPIPDVIRDGTILTIEEVKKQGKQHLSIDLSKSQASNADIMIDWIKSKHISTLNIAGPREKSWLGIYSISFNFLKESLN